MPTSYTPNLDLSLPEVGASRDTWGGLLNDNFSTLDQLLYMAMPIGAILDFCGPTPPAGWLMADGRLISRTTYSALFAVIGTYWGAGDGTTTFALPNLCGRSGVGPGTVIDQAGHTLSLSFSQSLGNLSGTILQAHLPNYALTTDVQGYHAHSGVTAPGGNHTHSTDVQGYHGHGVNDPTHSHSVNDPGHAHYYSSFNLAAVGGYGGDALVVGSSSTPVTYSSGTGISINGSGTGISIAGDGAHAHNISYSGNLQLGIYGDGSHQHTIYLGGSGSLFDLIQPVLCVTKIIYAGQQAAVSVSATTATALSVTLDERDELTLIREQLAELQALLMPPHSPRQRYLAAPLRGPH